MIKIVCVSFQSFQESTASEWFIIRRISGTSHTQCWAGKPLGAGVCMWPGLEGLIGLLCGLETPLALVAAEDTRAEHLVLGCAFSCLLHEKGTFPRF